VSRARGGASRLAQWSCPAPSAGAIRSPRRRHIHVVRGRPGQHLAGSDLSSAGRAADGVRVVRWPDTATAVNWFPAFGGGTDYTPRPAAFSAATTSLTGAPSNSPATPMSCSSLRAADRIDPAAPTTTTFLSSPCTTHPRGRRPAARDRTDGQEEAPRLSTWVRAMDRSKQQSGHV
jgi:hypothetical protein